MCWCGSGWLFQQIHVFLEHYFSSVFVIRWWFDLRDQGILPVEFLEVHFYVEYLEIQYDCSFRNCQVYLSIPVWDLCRAKKWICIWFFLVIHILSTEFYQSICMIHGNAEFITLLAWTEDDDIWLYGTKTGNQFNCSARPQLLNIESADKMCLYICSLQTNNILIKQHNCYPKLTGKTLVGSGHIGMYPWTSKFYSSSHKQLNMFCF